MGKLIYFNICSLDGYVADTEGKFEWGEPDEEVHTFVNEVVRPVGTYLYGRKMYEVLSVWETIGDEPGHPYYFLEFADIWRATDKVVYSRTLEGVSTARTRLEREFDPGAVRDLKQSSQRDLAIAGPNVAVGAFEAGLVDEVHLILAPVIVGGGNPVFPEGVRLELELTDQRRFARGMAYLRYSTQPR